jgi:2-C-methyl-D-erythritol 2,4-cyclodiphosphate synthase
MDFRVGIGYDSHRFAPERPLVIGGIRIPFEQGLKAHSDGDVLIHAICDALLGAAALKDIGTHFPDNDARFKNADSAVLLSGVATLLSERDWRVNNLDCVIVAEQPKMKPYIDRITERLATLLQTDPASISVKAKTNEQMGFTGTGEGIAAVAVTTIIKND